MRMQSSSRTTDHDFSCSCNCFGPAASGSFPAAFPAVRVPIASEQSVTNV